jgi:hypothetical protein
VIILKESTLTLRRNIWIAAILLLIFPLLSLVLSYFFVDKNICLFVAVVTVLISLIILLVIYAISVTLLILKKRKDPEDRSKAFAEFLVLADDHLRDIFKDNPIPANIRKDQAEKIMIINDVLRQISKDHAKLIRKKEKGVISEVEFNEEFEDLLSRKDSIIKESADIFEKKK